MTCNTAVPTVAVCDSAYYALRLEELVARERREYGLVGFRLFPAANQDASLHDTMRESLEMHEAYLAGEYTDLTDQEL